MAPTEGRVARPERRWDRRRGTPSCYKVHECDYCFNISPAAIRHAAESHVQYTLVHSIQTDDMRLFVKVKYDVYSCNKRNKSAGNAACVIRVWCG